MKYRITMISAALAVAVSAHAMHEATDTLKVATITAEKGMVVSRTDSISLRSTSDVCQALMDIPGLTVTDMGGNAGLKTVSLRGMGTAHTEIYIDGIRMSNLQSGQPDLGLIGMENLSSAVIDYAQNSISFTTARPAFKPKDNGDYRKFAMNAGFKTGSFGTYLPSLRLGWKLSKKICLSANAGGTLSDGDYPYRTTDGNGSDIQIRRSGNDLIQMHAGADIFGNMGDGYWQAKAYINFSDRGAPGSITWPSQERQKDRNLYIQGSLRWSSGRYRLAASSKVSYDQMDYMGTWGDSRYGQGEIQLNTSHLYRLKGWWHMSAALGGQWDLLESGNYGAVTDTAEPGEGISRMEVRSTVTSSFILDWFKADISLEYKNLHDIENHRNILALAWLSPSAGMRFRLVEGLELSAFGRRACRVPMFNELYYIGFGNLGLRPEDAWLTDIGAEWERNICRTMKFAVKVDGFFNWLDDKITSSPSSHDPNIWLPYNIGKVFSKGADLSGTFRYEGRQWKAGADTRYTFQDARDRTPGSDSFNMQIPYIARHSIVISGEVTWKGWRLDARWNCRMGRTDNSSTLEDWDTVDVGLSRCIRLSRKSSVPEAKVSISARNLTDTRYELTRGYPMPGRSIMLGISLDL